MNKGFIFRKLLDKDGWVNDAHIDCDIDGKIVALKDSPSRDIQYDKIDGYLIPGFINAHSHAFQYAMAGLAEVHDQANLSDNFWTWRTRMYEIALQINPDQLEDIATMLYAEMIRNGYTHVIEFHYLHHDKDGKPYENISEMGERLIAAASHAGIRITLIPILYRKGGFRQECLPEQRRFISYNMDEYQTLLETTQNACAGYSHANMGIGVHSLRAVSHEDIAATIELREENIPFHMHISEQLSEVNECQEVYGQRPVQWMLDNHEIDDNFNFVHATHMSKSEVRNLAGSGAQVVLCPSTEGNLGDGIFSLLDFQDFSGSWNIGTDSHVGLNPLEELRLLDYTQRLISHERKIFRKANVKDSGMVALQEVAQSGTRSMGQKNSAFFQIGCHLDGLVIDARHPLFAATDEALAATIVYSSDPSMYYGTLINGEWKVKNNSHIDNEAIARAFASAIHSMDIR